jgi:hypothetical protein
MSGQIINNENNTTTTTNNAQQQNTNTATTINFNPENPAANAAFKVAINAGTGFSWVHMKIFDKDGKKLIQEGGKKADQPKVSKTNNGYQWVYDADGLAEGNYKVIFYINCDKGCKEQFSRTLSIGAGKTNEVQQAKATTQTTSQTTTQNNQQQQNNQTVKPATIGLSSPGKITLDLSVIDPIDPKALEYCDKFQTSGAGCTNPHDQVVDGQTVTMSFPNGHPAIFCGSIPNNRRSEVGGLDRKCIKFF